MQMLISMFICVPLGLVLGVCWAIFVWRGNEDFVVISAVMGMFFGTLTGLLVGQVKELPNLIGIVVVVGLFAIPVIDFFVAARQNEIGKTGNQVEDDRLYREFLFRAAIDQALINAIICFLAGASTTQARYRWIIAAIMAVVGFVLGCCCLLWPISWGILTILSGQWSSAGGISMSSSGSGIEGTFKGTIDGRSVEGNIQGDFTEK